MDTSGDTADDQDGFDLGPVEVRVLAVLIEKSFVTPDNYPMSINAIMTGCNQLTGRDPVMELSEQAVQDAIDSLRRGSPPPPPAASGDASTEAERARSLRDALMEAMREDAPAGYDEPVQRYYEELLR